MASATRVASLESGVMLCGRVSFERTINGMAAHMPAGATLDWTLDVSAIMEAESDQIVSATWLLGDGLSAGAQSETATSTTLFISAPSDPSRKPYLCTITYSTTGGRTVPRQFWMYVEPPINFS